jgi:hypothetical protein
MCQAELTRHLSNLDPSFVGIKTAVTVMANADLFATGGRPLNYK